MARKPRQRISYVLPLANATAGHRLGVNGLAIDKNRSILYSAGRDGVIYAWDLDIHLAGGTSAQRGSQNVDGASSRKTLYRQHVQAHTHWINDLVLAQANTLVVSASSDSSVKVWRPHAERASPPCTIGVHGDYVKCLSSPSEHSAWIAAGGLDRKICLWDLGGAGQRLQINVADEETGAKGSVYALTANETLLVSGGPASIAQIWDTRSAKRVTSFVGHTDNIRSVLISSDNSTIMTASSDQTIKVWSITAGRCLDTLTMHTDSVWCLYSDHPQLSLFYSGDRSGMVAKTDTRRAAELGHGLAVALCQELEGVSKIVSAKDSVWTATASSSISRWADVDTSAGVQLPGNMGLHQRAESTKQMNAGSSPADVYISPLNENMTLHIPLSCLLRTSNTARFSPTQAYDRATVHFGIRARSLSSTLLAADMARPIPLRTIPEETVEGQHGLIKHILLNDKRRVLTVDTAGEVTLWDLLRCIPMKSFGKRHLEAVVQEVNTIETVAHWCAVDTRTGTLTCVLEENHCFDAEVYADELEAAGNIDVREDQRSKWVLRYLFAALIEEEIRRDESYRRDLLKLKEQETINHMQNAESWALPRPSSSHGRGALSPGFSIRVASPGILVRSASTLISGALPPAAEENVQHDSIPTRESHSRASLDREGDYFSNHPQSQAETSAAGVISRIPPQATTGTDNGIPTSSVANEKSIWSKDGTSSLGKRLRLPFSARRFGRSQTAELLKPSGLEDRADESEDSKSSKGDERQPHDFLKGTIQQIRIEYAEHTAFASEPLESLITPSLPSETPVITPPPTTTIIIQEEWPDSGGVADLFEGPLDELGVQADLIEEVAPAWLGEVLLRNQIPQKDVVRVSFMLEPYQNMLPVVTRNLDGTTERLNANRMLRAKKILAYIAERLESPHEGEESDGHAIKPEEYLELYCQDQLVPPTMTLATIRTHIWRSGSDVILCYRANGSRKISRGPHMILAERE